ncbi:MAG: TolC family protein [Gemmatimonadetes bacterium]|nr:TolC family protein [Gemmatimonadota bacterium]
MRTVRTMTLGLTLSAAPAYAQTPEPIDVGILIDQAPAEVSTLFNQMRDDILAVVGTAATIRMEEADVVSNGYDPAMAEANYLAMLEGEADLIIAFGPVNASVVAGRDRYPKPTILFGGVNRDLLDLPEPGATSGISNFTYLISSESYENDLRTFKTLHPFERVGLVIPPGPIDALELRERLPPLMEELVADYEIVPYESPTSVLPALDRVDAIYLLESLLIPDAEIRALAELMIERRVPSFSGSRRLDVELGLMATNQPREGIDTFFRRLALLVEAVVDGRDLADQPVFFDLNRTLTLNFHTASAVGVPIRYSMITTTEFVGEFANPLAERIYSLRELVTEVLASNPALQSDRRNVGIAEQDRLDAWSAYFPNLEASVTQSIIDRDLAAISAGNPQYSTDGKLSLTQTILSPDAIAGISIQNSLLAAERDRVLGAEWDLVVEASNAYLNTLILKANLEIRAGNLDVSKRNLQIARQSFEAGQTGRGDVLRLESESAQDMQTVVAAIAALEQAFHAINALADAPVDREIDVLDVTLEDGTFSDRNFELIRTTLDDPSLREPFEDWATLEAISNAPELRALDRNIDAVGRDAARNGVQRFIPTVAAGLDLNRNLAVSGVGAPPAGTGLSQFFTLGIVASVPLFDSNRRRIDRQTSLIRETQLRFERASVMVALERSVRDVVQDLTRESANIELSEISERAAAEALELTQAAYASGAVTVVELIDAQRNLLSARLGRASATYTFLATAIGLQRLIGYLTLLGTTEENEAYIQRFLDYLATLPGGGRP